MSNISAILSIPGNTSGKDYVIGDLHGCYTLLERLLVAVDFNTKCDRLFSVGDLIDRGPESLRCLQLLDEPWFFAVQGNHELMLLDFFWLYLSTGKLESLDDICGNGFLVYGGAWVEEYFLADRQCMTAEFDRCLRKVQNMPLMLVVGEGVRRFHVIHAELVQPDYRHSERLVCLDGDVDGWRKQQLIPEVHKERMYWGRTLMSYFKGKPDYPKRQSGLSTTFCGHTYANRPRQVLSHLCLDTGAFISLDTAEGVESDYGLTLFDVREERWVSAAYGAREFKVAAFPLT